MNKWEIHDEYRRLVDRVAIGDERIIQLDFPDLKRAKRVAASLTQHISHRRGMWLKVKVSRRQCSVYLTPKEEAPIPPNAIHAENLPLVGKRRSNSWVLAGILERTPLGIIHVVTRDADERDRLRMAFYKYMKENNIRCTVSVDPLNPLVLTIRSRRAPEQPQPNVNEIAAFFDSP